MTDLINGVDNLRKRMCCLEIDVESLIGEVKSLRGGVSRWFHEKEDMRYEIGVLRSEMEDLRAALDAARKNT